MTNWLNGLPAWAVFASIAGVGIVRGHFYYLGGRALDGGVQRLGDRARGVTLERARALVTRWGALVIVPAYFVVGLSMSVLVASGAARMPLRRFSPALTVAAMAWAGTLTWFGMTLLDWLATAG